MKKERFVMAAATLAVAIAGAGISEAQAQKYKSGILWDLKGPVKEVKTDSPFPMAEKKMKFSEEGHIKNRRMSYDEACRPVGYSLEDGDAYIRVKVTYTPDGRIDRITHVGNNGEGETATVFTFDNDGRKTDSVNMLSQAADGTMTMDLDFSNYIYDTRGNWISRTVNLTRHAAGADPQTAQFVETRQIKYYD